MDFEGYPKKSFTGNRSVLKVDLFKKGGGWTPPHFAPNEGIVYMEKKKLPPTNNRVIVEAPLQEMDFKLSVSVSAK